MKNEEIIYLNLEDRKVFNLKNFDIFKSFKGCRKLNLKGHSLETIEETNNFIELLKNFKELE